MRGVLHVSREVAKRGLARQERVLLRKLATDLWGYLPCVLLLHVRLLYDLLQAKRRPCLPVYEPREEGAAQQVVRLLLHRALF